jgi:hypothetical protein
VNGTRNLLEPIKAALGPDRTMAFMELVNALDLNPNDPELVLCAGMASFVVSITEFRTWGTGERDAMKEMLATFVARVDLEVAGAFTRGADEFQTELRLAAREIAQSEYRAAASLRNQAIMDEIEALKAATAELVRKESELKARQTVTPGRVARASTPASFLSPKVFAAIAVAFVLGWVCALFMLRPAPRAHAFIAHGRAVASMPARGLSPSADRVRVGGQRYALRRSQSSRTGLPSAQYMLGDVATTWPAWLTTRSM